MKFVATAAAVWATLGVCGASKQLPANAAVYELNARVSDRIPAVLDHDAVMYLADALGISDQFSVGSDPVLGDLLSLRAPLRSHSRQPNMVVVVNGATDLGDTPSFKVEDKSGHLDRAAALLARKAAAAVSGHVHELTQEIRVVSASESPLEAHFRLFDDRLVGLWQHYTSHRQAALGGASAISDRLFVSELAQLVHLDEGEAHPNTTVFAHLVSLLSVGRKAGFDSHSYHTACAALGGLLRSLAEKYNVLVVAVADDGTHSSARAHMQKRSQELEVVFKRKTASSSCFQSQEACEAGTDKCSGHGKCVESGKKCWSCACTASKKDGKTTVWAGSDCLKKDISAQAHILLWTGLALVVAFGLGIKMLAGVGAETLPGVLDAATLKKTSE